MKSVKKLTLTALLTALCYVAFTFIQIKIPTPAGYTSFHLGNVFCVLAALLIDGPTGGLAGALGMAIGDMLDPVYIVTTPKTIILKYIMGYVAGYFAHNVFHIKEKSGKDLTKYAVISIAIAMVVNIIMEPLFSYFYYGLILNNATKAASYLTVAKYVTTAVNGVLTIIVASSLYVVLAKSNIVKE